MTKEEPPTDVLSVKLGVIPRYSAVAKEEKPAVNTPFTSDLDRPASSRAFDAASAWCCKDDLFGTVPISSDSATPTIAISRSFLKELLIPIYLSHVLYNKGRSLF